MTPTSRRPLALVTGASSGIGRELAAQFAENDFDLVVTAEDNEIVTAARELERSGASVEAVQVDLSTGTFQAVYNASKSFDQSFALALRAELKDTGVTVTSLMPGPTETEFFERADMLDTKVGAGEKDDPVDVAREGFEALMAGKERAVSASVQTKLQGRGSRVLPDRVKAAMHGRMAEPGSADDE